MSAAEIVLAKRWFVEYNESPREIARRLGRSKSTLTRLLIQRDARKRQGRKMTLSSAAVDKLQKKLDGMIVKGDRKYEVTVGMPQAVFEVQGMYQDHTEPIARAWGILPPIAPGARADTRGH